MSTQRRRVLENSGLKDGVYIEGLDGKAYTVNDWQGGNAANSIIIASGNVKFRMALTEEVAMEMGGGYYEPFDNYMTAISDGTAAKADYDGEGNTANILKVMPSTNYAAGYCNAFVFPDGKTKGYLPSLGQLNIAYQNKDAVDAALAACGGTAIEESSIHWSSTFYSNGSINARFWVFYRNFGMVDSDIIINGHLVRPFANIS